jgi:hypothetical protein
MASQAVQQQPFKIIDGSGGWRDRCAKWCERHLGYLDGGALAYADTMGPGKTAALSLRGYLFDDPTLLALEEAGVDIEYPANLRESDQEPKKLKPVPADATQRAQYYADLRADDIVLLVAKQRGSRAISNRRRRGSGSVKTTIRRRVTKSRAMLANLQESDLRRRHVMHRKRRSTRAGIS